MPKPVFFKRWIAVPKSVEGKDGFVLSQNLPFPVTSEAERKKWSDQTALKIWRNDPKKYSWISDDVVLYSAIFENPRANKSLWKKLEKIDPTLPSHEVWVKMTFEQAFSPSLEAKVFKAMAKFVAPFIVQQENMFLSVFEFGTPVSNSVLKWNMTDLDADKTTKLEQNETALSMWANVRAYYNNYVVNDPFARFDGHNYKGRGISFYQIVNSTIGEYSPGGGWSVPDAGDMSLLNNIYMKFDPAAEGHLNEIYAFYDFDSYKYFLNGCENIAGGDLKSVFHFLQPEVSDNVFAMANNQLGPGEQIPPLNPITDLDKMVPFYSKVEFATEKRNFGANKKIVDTGENNLMSFLMKDSLKPFFNQLMSLYVDSASGLNNATNKAAGVQKWEDKPWILKEEAMSVHPMMPTYFSSTFWTNAIRIQEAMKDPDFFNLDLKGWDKGTCSTLIKKLSFLLFENQVKKILKSTLLHEESKNEGIELFTQPRYEETICYRIQKRDTATDTRQEWFVPNFPGVDIIKVFDNRIAFDSKNNYRIFALKATVAMNYHYQTPNGRAIGDPITDEALGGYSDALYGTMGDDALGETNNFENKVQGWSVIHKDSKEEFDSFSNEFALMIFGNVFRPNTINDPERLELHMVGHPELVLYEVPYADFEPDDEPYIYDSAPVTPNLSMYPYKGVDDKVLLVFATNLDRYIAPFESILATDVPKFEKTQNYARQHVSLKPGETLFKSEFDDVKYIEVFRLDTAPKQYEDFASAKRTRILRHPTLQDKLDKPQDELTGMSMVDTVEPNKDYYYIIRAVDFNDNVSNPTAVFHVYLMNDDGFINPTVEIYDMDARKQEDDLVTTAPTFKKILSISPTNQQLRPFVNDQQELVIGATNSLDSLGVFGKKFKIRLRSLKTNKKVDFNIEISKTLKKVTSVDEIPSDHRIEEIEVDTAEVP